MSTMPEHRYHVYIMASRSRTLYIGVTSALATRVDQHKADTRPDFSAQYQCHRLVYLETHDDIHRAIAREKQLKRWSRAKKLTLLLEHNPAWADLSEAWGKPTAPFQQRAHHPASLRSRRAEGNLA